MLLLVNAISFPCGDLNAVVGGTGLEGMSQRGLRKRREGKKNGKTLWKSERITPSTQKRKADKSGHLTRKGKLLKELVEFPRLVKTSKNGICVLWEPIQH